MSNKAPNDESMRTAMSSLSEFRGAAEYVNEQGGAGYHSVWYETLATLCYAARMVNDLAVDELEHEEILEAAREIEQGLGIRYAFDDYDAE